jgi:hypothetical protein
MTMRKMRIPKLKIEGTVTIGLNIYRRQGLGLGALEQGVLDCESVQNKDPDTFADACVKSARAMNRGED